MSALKPSFDTTLHVRRHCLCLATQRAARALARRFDEALKPVGITSGQFSLLTSLNQPEPPTVGWIAGLLAMDRTTLTANLKPLEREGLLTVTVDARDKRARRVALTPKGLQTLEAATPIWERVHREIDREIAAADPAALRTGLAALA